MILGIGIDLVELPPFEKLLTRCDNTLRRILTTEELEWFTDLPTSRRQVEWLAGRFAGKEAAIKAFQVVGTFGFLDFIISTGNSNKPELRFASTVPTVHKGRRLISHLSITHTGTTAGAIVVLEGVAQAREL